MCGRYSLEDTGKIEAKFKAYAQHFDLKPNYNVAPTQTMPVVVAKEGARQLELMHWGIPRVLGKDLVKELINTRSDKVFDRFWNQTVLNRRCLIPANGFYEWKALKDGKHPFYIHPKDQDLFAFAGIWSEWTDKDGKKFNSYSIMTTDPNKEMSDIHNRMPVILDPSDYDGWLIGENREELEPLLRPYHDGGLELFEVDRAVNSVRNNNKQLIRKLSA